MSSPRSESTGEITLANVYTQIPGESQGPEVYVPLGCLYLISALERAGIGVDFRDYQLFCSELSFPLSTDSFCSFLEDSARLVGVSCMVSMLPFVLLGLKRFKEKNPDSTVILGGPGPSGTADAIVSQMPWIDIVARGEGEETLVETVNVLTDGGDLRQVRGITYRDREGVRHNPPRPRLGDLDDVPFPAYNRVDLSRYTNVSVVSGRGCPFRCSFCDVGPLWGNKVLLRSVDNVVGELQLLRHEYGLERVNLVDDTFTLNRERTRALCSGIDGLGLTWSCLSRVDALDEDLLERMAHAGCDAVFLGIESGSNAVLNRINKRFTIQEATRKVDLTARYMKKVITSFIWGFPFETMDDFKLTMFSIVSMWYLKAMTGLMLLSPMPLSELGIEYRDQIEFSEGLCSVFASLGNVTPGMVHKRAEIPEEFKELITAYPDIFQGFYYIKSETIREKAEYLEEFCEKFRIAV